MHPYTDLDHDTIGDLRLRIGTSESGMNDIVPVSSITKAHMMDEISAVRGKIDEKQKEIEEMEAKKRQEIEEMRRQIETKYREQFVHLRKGEYAPIDTPVVLYQKVRYLDEEMGKYLAVYQFDFDNKELFEEALKYRDDLFSLFAPPEKSISLIRVSHHSVSFDSDPNIANMLKEYESFHGHKIGILIRDGDNLWIGWTDEDRINVTEDVFLKPKTDVTAVEDSGPSSTKEEIASRYFIFSILQGVLHNNKLLHLPEGISVFKENSFVVFSMADGWLEDNRFGTFAEIVNRTDQELKAGDMVLTTLYITRDDRYSGMYGGHSTYLKPWHNDRGRGERNRTHDAAIPDKQVLPVNLIDKEVSYSILYDEYRCDIDHVPTDKEGVYTFQTKRTGEKLREGADGFMVWNGFFDNRKDPKYDLRGLSDEEIYQWYLDYDKKLWNIYGDKDLIDPNGETASYKVPKGIRKDFTQMHYYLSAEKEYSGWSGKKSYANMEIREGEYLNLTYLNSVYVLYAIKNRKIGGWEIGGKIMDYANSIQYLNIALEYLRKREEMEAGMLTKYIDLYPDWQVDLSEWRMEHGYHRLTDTRAKRFAAQKKFL